VRYLNSRLQDFTSTIFSEMSALAVATGSINLGQGFPTLMGRMPLNAPRSERSSPGTISIRP